MDFRLLGYLTGSELHLTLEHLRRTTHHSTPSHL